MEEEATRGVNEDMPCLEFSAKSSEGNHGDSNYLPSFTVYTTRKRLLGEMLRDYLVNLCESSDRRNKRQKITRPCGNS